MKAAVITGAGRGLGRALALGLAEDQQYKPILIGRNEENLQETKREVKKHFSIESEVHVADLSDVKSLTSLCEKLTARCQVVDVLINNAAGWTTGPLESLEDTQIVNQVNITLTAAMLLSKHLKGSLLQSQQPQIVNIISTAGLPNASLGGASVAFYASKYAQVGFGDTLRQEYAKEGIRVCNILPGGFHGNSSYFDKADDVSKKFDESAFGTREVVESVQFVVSRSKLASVDTIVLNNP